MSTGLISSKIQPDAFFMGILPPSTGGDYGQIAASSLAHNYGVRPGYDLPRGEGNHHIAFLAFSMVGQMIPFEGLYTDY